MRFVSLQLFCILTLFSSCKDVSPQYVSNSSDYTSIGIDLHDIDKVIESSAKSLLKSDYVRTMNSKKILAISNIINQTGEDIDVEFMSRKLVRIVRESKKFTLTNATAGSGINIETMLDKSRDLTNNPNYKQHTTQELGTLEAPALALSGKFIERKKHIGKVTRVDYMFLLTLTDLKSGKVLWDNEEVISKVADSTIAHTSKPIANKPNAQDNKDSANCANAEDCFEKGVIARDAGDFTKAKEYFGKACDMGFARSCRSLGYLYENGLGVRQDYAKARELYLKACNANDSVGCGSLGILYHEGQGVRQNKTKAKEYFGRACDLGHQQGCDDYKNLKSQGY